ncbi:MAG TPA: hypothetical protein VKQ29_12755 [Aliidongia sp.]|nr:hypothetical protein [Aliidongia sp.]
MAAGARAGLPPPVPLRPHRAPPTTLVAPAAQPRMAPGAFSRPTQPPPPRPPLMAVAAPPRTSRPVPAAAAGRVIQRMNSDSGGSTGSVALTTVGTQDTPEQARLKRMIADWKRVLEAFEAGVAQLRMLGGRIDRDGLAQFGTSYISKAQALAKRVKSSNYSEEAFAALARFIRDAGNTAQLAKVANFAVLQNDLRTLTQLRAVSAPMKIYIDSVILHEFDYGPYFKEAITFGMVTEHLSGYRFSGLHGASSAHGSSLYKGLRVPDPRELNYTVSQLGPGFYLTEGTTIPMNATYAKSVADLSVTKHPGSPYLYRVLLHNPGNLTSSEVPESDWNNMKFSTTNPRLQQHMTSDLMRSEIVDNKPARQIKVNSGSFGTVMVMPPGFGKRDFTDWIKARFQRKKE